MNKFCWMIVLCLTIFVSGFSFAQTTGQEPEQSVIFGAKTFTLKNGMQAVLIPNHRAPIVHHMVWYKVGAADEPKGKSGLAHFFEHLMFKGTTKFPDDIFSKTVAKLGGQDNAFTSLDYTAYHQSIAKEYLPTIMEMEADRMKNLTLTDEVIETERQVILEERRSRIEDNPFARYGEKANALLYTNHPYGIPTIGWEHEIEALSHDDIRAFYKKWYAPENAILVVSGDLTLDEFKALAQKYYGSIPASGISIVRDRPDIPKNLTQDMMMKLSFRDPQIRQPSYQLKMIMPSETMDPITSMALDIAMEEFGGSTSSILYKKLVQEMDMALSAGVYYNSTAMDEGALTIAATLKDEKDFDQVRDVIRSELRHFVENGLTDETVGRIKERLDASAIYARDSLDVPARIFGAALSVGMGVNDVETWTSRLHEISTQTVNERLKQVFVLDGDYQWGQYNALESFLMPATKETVETVDEQGDSQ